MSRLRIVLGGIRALFTKRRAEEEINEELRDYLQAAVQAKVRSGMSRNGALRAARVEIGSIEAVKENIRSAGWESTVESVWHDLRYGARILRKNSGFTAIAVLTLALGVGANTAIFSLVDAFLLRELPVKDPQQLALIGRVSAKGEAAVYLPYTQGADDDYGQMNLVIRTDGDAAPAVAALRRLVQSLDKDMALRNVDTAGEDLDEYMGDHRSLTTLLTFFGGLALVLASIGLYGTMSCTVSRRTKELGIRMALGAQRTDMLRMVMFEALSLVALGAGIGIPLAMASERLLQSMLFGVKSTDPITMVGAISAMLVTAALAGFVPARRATQVDPMVALRQE